MTGREDRPDEEAGKDNDDDKGVCGRDRSNDLAYTSSLPFIRRNEHDRVRPPHPYYRLGRSVMRVCPGCGEHTTTEAPLSSFVPSRRAPTLNPPTHVHISTFIVVFSHSHKYSPPACATRRYILSVEKPPDGRNRFIDSLAAGVGRVMTSMFCVGRFVEHFDE